MKHKIIKDDNKLILFGKPLVVEYSKSDSDFADEEVLIISLQQKHESSDVFMEGDTFELDDLIVAKCEGQYILYTDAYVEKYH